MKTPRSKLWGIKTQNLVPSKQLHLDVLPMELLIRFFAALLLDRACLVLSKSCCAGARLTPVICTRYGRGSLPSMARAETQGIKCAASQHEKERRRVNEVHQDR